MQHFIAFCELKLELQSENAQSRSKSTFFFGRVTLKIWRMTLKNNRAPLLWYFKHCAAFRSHWYIQTGVTVRKCPIWVKIDDFFSRVTLKFDGWPSKTIGHFSKPLSSYMHHFINLCALKWSYSPETPNLGQIRRFLVLCDLEIWRMTFKKNRAPLLSYFKHCAAFRSHWWIQTGVCPETPNLGQIWRFF